jgi:cyanophycinase
MNEMNGLIALVGSGEYLPVMEAVDRHLLANSGASNRRPKVICLPTAAGREGEGRVERWSTMGEDHFSRLGADVRSLPVVDERSANDAAHAAAIEDADLIYFSGGDPAYLFRTMKDSLVWEAAQKAWARGAIYAGCSAGAMILAREIPDFRAMGLRSTAAFGLVPAAFIIPHFDAIPGIWKPLVFALRRRLTEGEVMIGVDEQTAIVGSPGGSWEVMGNAAAHLMTRDESASFAAGETFRLDGDK